MDQTDVILLWVLTALSFIAGVLRILLARKKGQPQPLLWRLQAFLFPALLLLSLLLWQTGSADIVFPAVMLGLLEEIVCIFLRRKPQKR